MLIGNSARPDARDLQRFIQKENVGVGAGAERALLEFNADMAQGTVERERSGPFA